MLSSLVTEKTQGGQILEEKVIAFSHKLLFFLCFFPLFFFFFFSLTARNLNIKFYIHI